MKKEDLYYVDPTKFSIAISEYNIAKKTAIENGEPVPIVPNYIGECFIKIANGVAQLHRFNRYTYKEDMIADGIECCLRYMHNFDITKTTKDGKVSAFSYFTKTVYWAFVRRIKKENGHHEKIQNMIAESNIDALLSSEEINQLKNGNFSQYVEQLVNQQIFFNNK